MVFPGGTHPVVVQTKGRVDDRDFGLCIGTQFELCSFYRGTQFLTLHFDR